MRRFATDVARHRCEAWDLPSKRDFVLSEAGTKQNISDRTRWNLDLNPSSCQSLEIYDVALKDSSRSIGIQIADLTGPIDSVGHVARETQRSNSSGVGQ